MLAAQDFAGPIYQRIARLLRSRIFHEVYARGSAIPSENDLAEEFGVARLTVRQAILELRREGALVSRRGSGTYVAKDLRMVRPVQFVGYLEDLVLQSLTLPTQVHPIRLVTAPAEVRKAYNLGRGAKVVRLDRIRSVKGEPVHYSEVFLPPRIANKLPLRELGTGSLWEIMARSTGVATTMATQTLGAVSADRDTSKALQVPRGAPLFFARTIGFNGTRPVNFADTYYRPEYVFFTAKLVSVAGDGLLTRTNRGSDEDRSSDGGFKGRGAGLAERARP